MGYIKPFNIMLIFLLSMQFAISDESLKCLLTNSQKCLEEFDSGSAQKQCGADQAIQCFGNVPKVCNISDSTSAIEQVKKIQQVFTDICLPGSEINLAYLTHKDCIFGAKLIDENAECYEIISIATSKYNLTGNTEEDEKELLKIVCNHRDEQNKCTSTKVKEICGEGAESFRRKLADPIGNLEDMMCNNISATFMHFWTLLLQVTAILMSLQYFRLTK